MLVKLLFVILLLEIEAQPLEQINKSTRITPKLQSTSQTSKENQSKEEKDERKQKSEAPRNVILFDDNAFPKGLFPIQTTQDQRGPPSVPNQIAAPPVKLEKGFDNGVVGAFAGVGPPAKDRTRSSTWKDSKHLRGKAGSFPGNYRDPRLNDVNHIPNESFGRRIHSNRFDQRDPSNRFEHNHFDPRTARDHFEFIISRDQFDDRRTTGNQFDDRRATGNQFDDRRATGNQFDSIISTDGFDSLIRNSQFDHMPSFNPFNTNLSISNNFDSIPARIPFQGLAHDHTAFQNQLAHEQMDADKINKNRRFMDFGNDPHIVHQFQSEHDRLSSFKPPQREQTRPSSSQDHGSRSPSREPVGSLPSREPGNSFSQREPIVGHSIFVNADADHKSKTSMNVPFENAEGPIIIQKGDRKRGKPAIVHFGEDRRVKNQQYLNSKQSSIIEEKFGPAFTVIHGGPGQPDIIIPELEKPAQSSLSRPRPSAFKPDISYSFQPDDKKSQSFATSDHSVNDNAIPNQVIHSFIPSPSLEIGFIPPNKQFPALLVEPVQGISHILSSKPDMFTSFTNVGFQGSQSTKNPSGSKPQFEHGAHQRPKGSSQTRFQNLDPKIEIKHAKRPVRPDIFRPDQFSNLLPDPDPNQSLLGPPPSTYRPHVSSHGLQTSSSNDSGSIVSQSHRPSSIHNQWGHQASNVDRDRPSPQLFNKVEREYSYGYAVNAPSTGDHKAAFEVKGPDGVVKGQYSLLQPDGLFRMVTYQADQRNGFQANVEYFPAYLR